MQMRSNGGDSNGDGAFVETLGSGLWPGPSRTRVADRERCSCSAEARLSLHRLACRISRPAGLVQFGRPMLEFDGGAVRDDETGYRRSIGCHPLDEGSPFARRNGFERVRKFRELRLEPRCHPASMHNRDAGHAAFSVRPGASHRRKSDALSAET
jgi:hypothetical protein